MSPDERRPTRSGLRLRWLSVLGAPLLIVPYNDSGCGYAVVLLPIIAFTIALAIVLASFHARTAPERQRRDLANGTLLLFLAFLLWMDAGPVIMARGEMVGRWWVGYATFAAIAVPLLFWASGWRKGELLPTLGRIALLLAATPVIASIPWNSNKGDALLVRSVLGEPLEVVQEKMHGEWVTLGWGDGAQEKRLEGTVGEDLDLVALRPETVEFFALGWGVIWIRDGHADRVWYLYD